MPSLQIAKALKRKRLSRRQFAKRLGIDYKNVSRIFYPDANPRFSDLKRYAMAIGCKVRDLIDG